MSPRLHRELRASLKNALDIARDIEKLGAGEGSRPSLPVAPDGTDLQARADRLEKALREIADWPYPKSQATLVIEHAREALAEPQP